MMEVKSTGMSGGFDGDRYASGMLGRRESMDACLIEEQGNSHLKDQAAESDYVRLLAGKQTGQSADEMVSPPGGMEGAGNVRRESPGSQAPELLHLSKPTDLHSSSSLSPLPIPSIPFNLEISILLQNTSVTFVLLLFRRL